MGSFSLRATDAFLDGQSSFPSPFLLAPPLVTALGFDEDAPSFALPFPSSFLRAAIALTYALSLAASIFTER